MKRYPLRAALAALLLMGLLLGCGGAAEETPEATEAATEVAEVAPTEAAQATATTAAPAATPTTAATLPPPPQPTAVPTDVPPTATETPAVTDTPTATAVPPTPIPPTPRPVQPTAIPPTAAPPTNTPVPPPPSFSANGLVGEHFALQDRAELKTNGNIWFEFRVGNTTGGDVPYSAVGVMPKKDGVDRPEWLQDSWAGPDVFVKPGGLSWEDHINLPEPGNYTLRLVICFDGFDPCLQNRGTWISFSPEISISIQ